MNPVATLAAAAYSTALDGRIDHARALLDTARTKVTSALDADTAFIMAEAFALVG